MDEILRYPLPLKDKMPDPFIRLDLSEDAVIDISAMYSHHILSLDEDFSVSVDMDIAFQPPMRTGGSIIKMIEGSGFDKSNIAIENSVEDRMNKRFLNAVFTNCFNPLLDKNQKIIYLSKKFPFILHSNNLNTRNLTKRYDANKRKFLYNTAREIMVEGMMLETMNEFGEFQDPAITHGYANKRIKEIDPNHIYNTYLRQNMMLLYDIYPFLKERIPMELFKEFQKYI